MLSFNGTVIYINRVFVNEVRPQRPVTNDTFSSFKCSFAYVKHSNDSIGGRQSLSYKDLIFVEASQDLGHNYTTTRYLMHHTP